MGKERKDKKLSALLFLSLSLGKLDHPPPPRPFAPYFCRKGFLRLRRHTMANGVIIPPLAPLLLIAPMQLRVIVHSARRAIHPHGDHAPASCRRTLQEAIAIVRIGEEPRGIVGCVRGGVRALEPGFFSQVVSWMGFLFRWYKQPMRRQENACWGGGSHELS